MMNDKRQIEEEVRKTLESLDRVDRVSPKPFLFTRILARMQHADNVSVGSFQPYYRLTMAVLTILVIFNLVTFSLNLPGGLISSDNNAQEEVDFDQYYPTLTTIDNLSMEITESN